MALTNSLAALAFLNLVDAGHPKSRALLEATKVSATVVGIALTWRKLDRRPTQLEFADAWGMSERKAQKEWALFKEAFPAEASPYRAAEWLHANTSSRLDDRSAPLTIEAPPNLTASAA
jgi:hypothetical protein